MRAIYTTIFLLLAGFAFAAPGSPMPRIFFNNASLGATTARPDSTYNFNPMHVGDKWWYRPYTGGEPHDTIWLKREVVADTLINGDTYYKVIGLGGAGPDEWMMNRGDTLCIYDAHDLDNNPQTQDVPFFRWDWEYGWEADSICTVYEFLSQGAEYYDELVPMREVCLETYNITGALGETVLAKHFMLRPSEPVFLEFQSFWAENYGIFCQIYEDGRYELAVAKINGIYYGDSTLVVAAHDQTNPMQPGSITCSNYPNPFNGQTNIKYALRSQGTQGTLTIYNVRGQRLARQAIMGSGVYKWDCRNEAGHDQSSGVYFYRIEDDNGSKSTNKMLYLK